MSQARARAKLRPRTRTQNSSISIHLSCFGAPSDRNSTPWASKVWYRNCLELGWGQSLLCGAQKKGREPWWGRYCVATQRWIGVIFSWVIQHQRCKSRGEKYGKVLYIFQLGENYLNTVWKTPGAHLLRLQSLKDPGSPCFKCALRCQRPWLKTLNRWELGHEFNDFHIKIWLVVEDARRIFDPVNVSLNILFGMADLWMPFPVESRSGTPPMIFLGYSPCIFSTVEWHSVANVDTSKCMAGAAWSTMPPSFLLAHEIISDQFP